MKALFAGRLEDAADLENLPEAWREFSRGKKKKADVQEFSFHLMDNLLSLRDDILDHTYRHGGYQAFRISDPKPRDIHKAPVRDRVLHHALYRTLYPFFDKAFIADSFSCRIGKGTHRALRRFKAFGNRVSRNNTRTCWVLKGDIKKFFASIDQATLIDILRSYIRDDDLLWLLGEVIGSFSSTAFGKGLPLGNLTSQLLVNVYMNEFDQFVKHKLKAKYYIRYADDFVIFSPEKEELERFLWQMNEFLERELKLTLHPDKAFVKTLASGVDFLGWVHFSDHRVLRTATKRRMMKRMRVHPTMETIASYAGLLRHGNTHKLAEKVYRQAQQTNGTFQ